MKQVQTIDVRKKNDNRSVYALILLCWLAYSCSYLGKVNYAANINQVMGYFNVSHAEAGLVSTFLFFSYGIGQFVNGFFCKKYNVKWMIFLSLMVSGLINMAVAFTPSFEIVKYLWLVNGIALSVLWPTVIRLLSETLSKRDMAKASVIMGTTVASGTLLIYGLSALFTSFSAFKLAFVTAGIIMPTVAFIWLFAMPGITKRAKTVSEKYDEEDRAAAQLNPDRRDGNVGSRGALYLTIAILAVCAIATNLINDGLKTWIPSIMKEQYDMGESLSIVLSLALPLVAIFSNILAVKLHKYVPDFVMQCALAFGTAGIIIGVVIAGLSLNQFVLTLVGFAFVCFLVASCNNLITSIFPLFMKDKINSGRMAGILNGFCYVGSTISSYGLGLVADNWGWNAVFWLLFAVCAAVVVFAGIYTIVKKIIEGEK